MTVLVPGLEQVVREDPDARGPGTGPAVPNSPELPASTWPFRPGRVPLWWASVLRRGLGARPPDVRCPMGERELWQSGYQMVSDSDVAPRKVHRQKKC